MQPSTMPPSTMPPPAPLPASAPTPESTSVRGFVLRAPIASDLASETIGTVAIIGLGLIGGSVARDLAAHGIRVLGHDRDPATLREAIEAGVVRGTFGDRLEGIEEADVVIVATPVDEGPRVLAAIAARPTAARLITDVGSTKRSVVAAATAHGMGERFVGSHPLAGDHRNGWQASRRELFCGARVYLCPAIGATNDAAMLARSLWALLGAVPELCDAAGHDELLAWSSHLPQLTATALALALHEAGVAHALLGSGGLDTTRLAGSSPELWTAIVGDNAAALDAAVQMLERQLGELRHALRDGDTHRLLTRFSAARQWSVTLEPVAQPAR